MLHHLDGIERVHQGILLAELQDDPDDTASTASCEYLAPAEAAQASANQAGTGTYSVASISRDILAGHSLSSPSATKFEAQPEVSSARLLSSKEPF